MNKILTGIFAVAAVGAMAATPSSVDAAQKLIPGTSCDNYNANEANDIDRLVYGIRTLIASSRNVVCGLPRDLGAAGGSVVVNGETFGGVSMPITVYSYTKAGVFSGSKSASPTGLFSIPLFFNAAELPAANQLAALVTLPASAGGVYYMTSTDH